MKESLKYIAKDNSFIIEIENRKIENEDTFVGSISTNCEQKIFLAKELLVVTGKIVKDLPTFGNVTKIDNYLKNEIKFISFQENKVFLKNEDVFFIDELNDYEIEFEFFNQKEFEMEIKNFIKYLNSFIENYKD